MDLKILAASAFAAVMALPVAAAPVDVELSFDGTTVTFFGLNDAIAGPQQATSFNFSGLFDNYSDVGTGMATDHAFVFEQRALTGWMYNVEQTFDPGDSGLYFLAALLCVGGPSDSFCSSIEVGVPFGGNAFARGDSDLVVRPAAPIPLPAGGVLLISAIACATALKRTKSLRDRLAGSA